MSGNRLNSSLTGTLPTGLALRSLRIQGRPKIPDHFDFPGMASILATNHAQNLSLEGMTPNVGIRDVRTDTGVDRLFPTLVDSVPAMLPEPFLGRMNVGTSKRPNNAHVGVTRSKARDLVDHVIAIGATLADCAVSVAGTVSLTRLPSGSLACHSSNIA